jgi:hypothetical protein
LDDALAALAAGEIEIDVGPRGLAVGADARAERGFVFLRTLVKTRRAVDAVAVEEGEWGSSVARAASARAAGEEAPRRKLKTLRAWSST